MPPRPAERRNPIPPTGSPLSPKMQSLGMPSPTRRMRPVPNPRQHSGSAASLRMPSLPRFHPANFPSQNSSTTTTPATGPNSPQPPLSPRAYHSQYSDMQHPMFLLSPGQQPRVPVTKPTSPRLIPTGSPGPVTPLELEGNDGYLTAGVAKDDHAAHVDKLIREEALRRAETPTARSTSVGGR